MKIIIEIFNSIIDSFSKFPFNLLIILIIIFYHIIIFFIRDRKYIKRIQQLKNKKIISIDDLVSKPIITFVVPAWNEDQTLKQTLNALLNLSYPYYRVIVNAGGNEETILIADFFKKYKNFIILKQEAGKGKIKAINDAISQISEGIIILMDADVQINEKVLLNMIHPIINENETVVTATLKPHESIKDKDLVKFLYIDRNNRFRKKLERYIDITGIITAIKYDVVRNVNKFSEAKFSDDGRAIGNDLKKYNYRIYYIANLLGETYNYPEKIKKFFPQQLRWMENAYYGRIKRKKILFLIKLFFATLISIYLLIFPFLIFNINLIVIGLYILFFLYLKKIRKIIFFKKTDANSLELDLNIIFYVKLIFYIYLEAVLIIIVAIEIMFFKKNYKKRKNIF